MFSKTIQKYSFLVLAFVLLNGAFNNCGKGFQIAAPLGKMDLASNAPSTGTSSKSAGVFDANCLQNNAYDACVFWKNPVAARGSAFPSLLKKGTDLTSIQNFGVKLENRIDGQALTSKSIRVYATGGSLPVFQNGQLRSNYRDESSSSWTAQIMSYFWLNFEETEIKKRTGTFYASGKSIAVDAYTLTKDNGSDPANNGFFSSATNRIFMGYVTDAGGTSAQHEVSLGSETLMHEMGHANLYYANPFNSAYDSKLFAVVADSNNKLAERPAAGVYTSDTVLFYRCSSELGCSAAINEGQADFHYMMIFPEKPLAMETFSNNINGGKDFSVPRNALLTKNWQVKDFYNGASYTFASSNTTKSGEIHGMGSAYASILYEIYTHPQMNPNHFEKMFVEHLKMLTAESDFRTSLNIFLTLSENMSDLFGGTNYSAVITEVFKKKGVSN